MTRKRKRRAKSVLLPTPAIPRWAYMACLAIVIVFFSLIRFRLRDMPLERDEGEYAYAGQLILQGIAPYRLAYSMKLPGTHAAYALTMAMFGQTPSGIHLGLLLVNAATVWLMFLLGRRIFGPLAGAAAALSYATLSTSEAVIGFAAHATNYVVLAAVGALMLCLRAEETKRGLDYFFAGVLAALAFLCKQPGLFFGLFCGVYLALRAYQQNRTNLPRAARGLLTYAAGFSLPLLCTCFVLFFANSLGRMWFWSFSYAAKYGSSQTLAEGWHGLGDAVPELLRPSWPLWLMAAFGIGVLLWDSRVQRQRVFLFGLLLFSWAAVCSGLYFRLHYFVMLLPVVSLFVGLAVSSSAHWLFERSRSLTFTAMPVLALALAFVYSTYSQRDFLFMLTPDEACQKIYVGNPFPEAIAVSNYLRQQTPEQSTIAVIGSEPEIYFYSHRHSATGYIYMYPLMEHHDYVPAMQAEMETEIENSLPEYLIFVKSSTSWLRNSNSDISILEWFHKYATNYQIVGVADGMLPEANYVWGAAAKTYRPKADNSIFVLKRKSS
jgi:hypothetical protein